MPLQLTAEAFAFIKRAVQQLDTPQMRQAYLNGEFPRSERCEDLDQRYRWDLLHFGRLKAGARTSIKEDSPPRVPLGHACIDAELKAIVPPLARA